MLLGTRNFANGDVRKLVVDYSDWLFEGYHLNTVTATVSPSTTKSTVGTITLSPAEHKAFIVLNCATVNESFTLNVIATDTFGQTVNDQVLVNIVAPGALS
jgi:hypothetical protein